MSSTGKPRRKEISKTKDGGDSSTFVAHPMGFIYKGVAHLSESVPIKKQQDLLTYCLSGVRKHTSVRCDSLLWKNFKEACQSEGLSTCRVLEKLLLGWLVGVQSGRVPNVTVSVDMPRIVKRVRRRQIYFENEIDVTETVDGGIETVTSQPEIRCGFCDKAAVGTAVHEESGKKVFVCAYHKGCLEEHPKWTA